MGRQIYNKPKNLIDEEIDFEPLPWSPDKKSN